MSNQAGRGPLDSPGCKQNISGVVLRSDCAHSWLISIGPPLLRRAPSVIPKADLAGVTGISWGSIVLLQEPTYARQNRQQRRRGLGAASTGNRTTEGRVGIVGRQSVFMVQEVCSPNRSGALFDPGELLCYGCIAEWWPQRCSQLPEKGRETLEGKLVFWLRDHHHAELYKDPAEAARELAAGTAHCGELPGVPGNGKIAGTGALPVLRRTRDGVGDRFEEALAVSSRVCRSGTTENAKAQAGYPKAGNSANQYRKLPQKIKSSEVVLSPFVSASSSR